MSGNTLVCNCSTYDFVVWFQQTQTHFTLKEKYECMKEQEMDTLLNTPAGSLCSKMPIWLSLCGVLVIASVIVSAISWRKRSLLKRWFYFNSRLRLTLRRSADCITEHVVFVVCHTSDSNLLSEVLFPHLKANFHEHSPFEVRDTLSVSVHDNEVATVDRDSVRNLALSKVALLFVSPSFIRSPACELMTYAVYQSGTPVVFVCRESVKQLWPMLRNMKTSATIIWRRDMTEEEEGLCLKQIYNSLVEACPSTDQTYIPDTLPLTTPLNDGDNGQF